MYHRCRSEGLCYLDGEVILKDTDKISRYKCTTNRQLEYLRSTINISQASIFFNKWYIYNTDVLLRRKPWCVHLKLSAVEEGSALSCQWLCLSAAVMAWRMHYNLSILWFYFQVSRECSERHCPIPKWISTTCTNSGGSSLQKAHSVHKYAGRGTFRCHGRTKVAWRRCI